MVKRITGYTENKANSQIRSVVKPVVLIFIPYYLPGEKSGGPVQSISNLVNSLDDEFYFRIITSDRDWGDIKPYETININQWNRIGKSDVYYVSENNKSISIFADLIRKTSPNILYINSFFDPTFAQKPLWIMRLRLTKKIPIVLAPRGEFSEGAFNLKYWKKAPYTWFTNKLKLFDQVIWHASTSYEATEIQSKITNLDLQKVCVASDIPASISTDISNVYPTAADTSDQGNHQIAIVFLSRITRKKNLDYALKILSQVKARVKFDIYGPLGEPSYWAECQVLLKDLPQNITAKYHGLLDNKDVISTFRKYDIFLFPTLGENYGHVIAESLLAGTAVLVSDTTPWRQLEKQGLGWDVPLMDTGGFVGRIEKESRRSSHHRQMLRKLISHKAKQLTQDSSITDANRLLFRSTLACGDSA